MICAPYPEDEAWRLATLERFGLLSESHDPFLDALTVTVARAFHAPISAVSFIDRERQFFKAITGLDVRETARSCSFCAHVLWWPEPMVVLDARADERFVDNPLVVDAPHIRFYAGAPVYLRGVCLGSLCVIDHRPRADFDDGQIRMLKGAASAVEERLIQMTTEAQALGPGTP
ncbi:GAF domain-containing protein [Roseateles sp. L2-2]|uniref:GAF domain-containing protein n=1 Tax=Roseateles sp. L2-2 TaxID=3422597 RepID=UPI003D36568C